jgi:hypothetical protein
MTAPAASATAHYLIHGAVGLGCDHEGIEVFGRGFTLAVDAKPDRRITGGSWTADADDAAAAGISLGVDYAGHANLVAADRSVTPRAVSG